MKTRLYTVIAETGAERNPSVCSYNETLEAAKEDAACRASADGSQGYRYHVLGPVGYFGKPVVSPEWHPITETPAAPSAPPSETVTRK